MWYKAQQDKATAALATGSDSVPDDSISRPPGERSKNGWNLQTVIGLDADGDLYNAILVCLF